LAGKRKMPNVAASRQENISRKAIPFIAWMGGERDRICRIGLQNSFLRLKAVGIPRRENISGKGRAGSLSFLSGAYI